MALSRTEALEILRHVQLTLEELDPVLAEELATFAPLTDDPRPYLFQYLERLSSAIAARSAGPASGALANLNRFVATESGRPITDIRLVATGVDQERFELAETSLTHRPDYDAVVADIREILTMLHDAWREG